MWFVLGSYSLCKDQVTLFVSPLISFRNLHLPVFKNMKNRISDRCATRCALVFILRNFKYFDP